MKLHGFDITLLHRIQRKLMHLRLCPIRVYCLHHVCKYFDPELMHEGDWMELEIFKRKVLALQRNGVKFIALTEAYRKLRYAHSVLAMRFNRYAVLTFDDGYASLKEVLPWLHEQGIPVTLFVNPEYANGMAYRDSEKESYLTMEELVSLGVELGMHGLRHYDVSKMDEDEFREFVDKSIAKTSKMDGYISFWAYTWGRHNMMSDSILRENSIIPVYIDGMKNYNDASCIHRELL